jgi:hypothetical protein
MADGARIETVPESFHDLLNSGAVALVGTLSPSGAPQVSPVWFTWDGTRIRFRIETRTQKYKNLERDPRISIAVIDPGDSSRYIEFRGTATFSTEHDDAFLSEIARKYLNTDALPPDPEEAPPTIVVIPDKIIAKF